MELGSRPNALVQAEVRTEVQLAPPSVLKQCSRIRPRHYCFRLAEPSPGGPASAAPPGTTSGVSVALASLALSPCDQGRSSLVLTRDLGRRGRARRSPGPASCRRGNSTGTTRLPRRFRADVSSGDGESASRVHGLGQRAPRRRRARCRTPATVRGDPQSCGHTRLTGPKERRSTGYRFVNNRKKV
jgi:hypothetical protein